MRSTFHGLIAVLSEYLGRCPKCMRQAFVFMLGAFGVALVVALTTSATLLLMASQIVALALAGLWFAHLTAFALRAVKRKNTSPVAQARKSAANDPAPRRQFLLTFTKSFVFVATVTALPARPALGSGCPCGKNQKCCWNYDGTIFDCAPLDATCCTNADSPWHCPNQKSTGHNCSGDNGDCR